MLMSNPISLDDAANSASEIENKEDTEVSESEEVDTPVESKPTPKVEAPKVEQEETFTKVNPNDLPEDVKPIYKSLLADYTKKRQLESQEVKDLRKEVEELRNGKSSNTAKEPEVEKSPTDIIREVAENTFVAKQEELWDKEASIAYPTLDGRLNSENPLEYDELLDDYVRDRLTDALESYYDANATKLGFDYKSNAAEFIKKFDEREEKRFKELTARQSELLKKKEGSFRRSSPTTVKGSSTPTGRMTIEEAAEAALSN